MKQRIIIDAKDGVIGRIASYAAKQALFGKEIIIVNCNESIVTGKKGVVLEQYRIARVKGGSWSRTGPQFPKSPERLMKRTVRGMLSHKQKRGEEALDRVMCYNKVPAEYESAEKVTFVRKLKTGTTTLKRLQELL